MLGRQPCPQSCRLDEVLEHALPVDLEHRKKLAVTRFEARIAVDRHHLELELCLGLGVLHDLESAGAKTAARSGVEHDSGYGYKPRVVVASATRRTASP